MDRKSRIIEVKDLLQERVQNEGFECHYQDEGAYSLQLVVQSTMPLRLNDYKCGDSKLLKPIDPIFVNISFMFIRKYFSSEKGLRKDCIFVFVVGST